MQTVDKGQADFDAGKGSGPRPDNDAFNLVQSFILSGQKTLDQSGQISGRFLGILPDFHIQKVAATGISKSQERSFETGIKQKDKHNCCP
jgi:hypothetical protein